MKYFFPKELIKGLIKARPNRFLMNVELNGEIVLCHCPATGRIGGVVFKDIECLLSESDNPNRRTRYTVEAVKLSGQWVGINQVKSNDFIEFFLKNGLLKKMIKGKIILREQKLGKSRIDFKIDDHYLEVKTPLINLPFGGSIKGSKFNSFNRLIKHFDELILNLREGTRAIILLCYQFNAKPFTPPTINSTNDRIVKKAKQAANNGVESWQVNLRIDSKGVSLIDYFKLELF